MGIIDIEVQVSDETSGIQYVKFYVDDDFKESNWWEPYGWTWDEQTFGRRTIKAIVYNNVGNYATDEVVVWKLS